MRSKDGVNAAIFQLEEKGTQSTDFVDNNSPDPLLTHSMSWAVAAAYQAPVRQRGGQSKTMRGTRGTTARSLFRRWRESSSGGLLCLPYAVLTVFILKWCRRELKQESYWQSAPAVVKGWEMGNVQTMKAPHCHWMWMSLSKGKYT
eukprot:14557071-Ditylum_brightwellii.AAC.1